MYSVMSNLLPKHVCMRNSATVLTTVLTHGATPAFSARIQQPDSTPDEASTQATGEHGRERASTEHRAATLPRSNACAVSARSGAWARGNKSDQAHLHTRSLRNELGTPVMPLPARHLEQPPALACAGHAAMVGTPAHRKVEQQR